MTLLLKRLIAGFLDYVVIGIYALALYVVVTSVAPLEALLKTSNPINGQLIGFITLTLPVFLYFYFSEKGSHRATIGKRITKIQVSSTGSILKRNLFKFLPWEMAHLGVHWIFYYSNKNIETPFWVWFCLITPQATVFLYCISIIWSNGKSSIYDKWSQTDIIQK
ncbi:RDD family protein [Hanstruepera ponticola]|uniref:RDD family protein n=1 Tax=Hanstruepera ponticola TaxID=2042995 RepID=UPI00177F0E42|nr:RDD family protein [Hanstruepera ponticola]